LVRPNNNTLGASGPCAGVTSGIGVGNQSGRVVRFGQRIQEFHNFPLRKKAQFVQGTQINFNDIVNQLLQR
jgi:hypothetical protein